MQTKYYSGLVRLTLSTLVFWGIGCHGTPGGNTDTLTQYSTLGALMTGFYGGQIPSKVMLQYGDFGIGAFDRLDGEMVILDQTVYQIKADGKVYTPDLSIRTPYAVVCRFTPDLVFELQAGDLACIHQAVDKAAPNPNLFHAIRIKGAFSSMKTRSVPAQSEPYLPLAEVAKKQQVFDLKDVSGTIVGLRCPAYVKGINFPGYHFHFISDDRTCGGHVLALELKAGTAEIYTCHKFHLILPEGKAFADLDLAQDSAQDQMKVIGTPK